MIRGERGGNALAPRFWPELPPRRMGFKAPENLRTTQRPPPVGKPQTSRVRGRRRA